MEDLSPQAVAEARAGLGVPPERIPRSVAIIMDGNGRWARARGLSRVAGHQEGAKVVRKIVTEAARLGLESLTLYSFSIENWRRPNDEVNALMHLYAEYLVSQRPNLHRLNIRLRHLGRLDGLSPKLQQQVLDAIELTKDNDRMAVCIAFNYGGRAEIVEAVRRLMANGMRPEDIDEDIFSSHLYTANLPDPDLIIRTAGEMRVSNFLLWQGAYAEFYSTTVYWPDFDSEDIDQALLAYSQRKRRFGSLPPEDDERPTSRQRPSKHSPKR